jgi:serine/threonine protein kinase
VISLPPKQRKLGQEECKRIIKDLLLVDEMHNRGFIHFDLKPDNILIKPTGELVLCDGSLAATVAETKVERYFVRGTPGYMAPEVVNADPIVNPFAADMYAVGVILAFLRNCVSLSSLTSGLF